MGHGRKIQAKGSGGETAHRVWRQAREEGKRGEGRGRRGRTTKEDVSKGIDFVLLGGGEFLSETFLGAALVIKGAFVLVAVAVFGAKDVFALAGVSKESDLDGALPAARLVGLDGFLDNVRLRDGDRTRR